uniref:39S ribosomal protein L55, mitochondrial n=1 Tax=Panagrellus redivivus TaxID=6233 RepID=A0A7E4ZZ10_PANRE
MSQPNYVVNVGIKAKHHCSDQRLHASTCAHKTHSHNDTGYLLGHCFATFAKASCFRRRFRPVLAMLANMLLSKTAICVPSTFSATFSTSSAALNAYRASLGKLARSKYIKQYQTLIMRPDGSTIYARTKEPRHFVQLPLNLSSLSEDERRQRLAARKPKAKAIKQEVIDDNFDLESYATMFKKKAKKAAS